MVCATLDHERWKTVPAWWRDQEWLGATTTHRYEELLVWKNCRTCGSTLGRHVPREEVVMEAPEGFWISATGYARLAEEMERAGHLDLLKYFEKRSHDAAVARFDEACAAAVPQLVAVDQVDEQLERTEVVFAPNPWAEAQP
jgi:hypothetical protein